jgi:hypothetical protein
MSIAAKCVCGGSMGFCNGKGNKRFPCVYRQDFKISFDDERKDKKCTCLQYYSYCKGDGNCPYRGDKQITNTKMRQFVLLKDLPNAKAGAIYRQSEDRQNYSNFDLLNGKSWDVTYPSEYVENNPEWFEEKIDKIVIRHLQQHDRFRGNGGDTFWYQFSASQAFSTDKFPAIERAIENSLNLDYRGKI